MTIENRNLTPGMTLIGRYHKQEHKCTVIQGEGDKLRYRLEDGREFKSPSAAGMAITGHACDGWHFWSVATAEPTPKQPAQDTTNSETNIAAGASSTEAKDAPAPDAQTATGASTAGTEEQKETANTPVTPASGAELGTAKKSLFRTPNQKGVENGMVRWYCQACGESFLAPYGEIPSACPQGHKA
jgi:hypothetical protein